MKTKELSGQIAIVTGGSQGIGFATAKMLAERGADIFLCYYDNKDADDVIELIATYGTRVVGYNADISKKENVEKLFSQCIRTLGKPDILVSNAGGGIPPKPLLDITEEDFDFTFGLNVKSHLFCFQQALLYMNEGGRIVITASSSVVNPSLSKGIGIYIASKSALIALMKNSVNEFAQRGISINAVLPGLTNTSLAQDHPADFLKKVADETPYKRIGEPTEVAEIIAFLCEKRSQWLTGQAIVANGGSIT